jgi:nucleoside 2-deoxyribosyltransferase
MKIFISYKYTGEDIPELKLFMKKICDSLGKKNHNFYCTLWEDEEKFNSQSKIEILQHAFNEIDKSDLVLVLLKSNEKSEGMLVEFGYCLANRKRIILMVSKDVKKTYLRDLTKEVIEYDTEEDLINKLEEYNL